MPANVLNSSAQVNGKTLLLAEGTQPMTGILDLGSIGKVKFPAAQSASADPNTLDDYEEGTWTPVIGGSGGTSGQTYSLQAGYYVKKGKEVTAWFTAVLSAKGTITGNVEIQGLPFTLENVNLFPPVTIGYWTALTTAFVFLGGFGVGNTTTAAIRGAVAAATGLSALTTADIGNTTQLTGQITFRASN